MNIFQKIFIILLWVSLTLLASTLTKILKPKEEELSRKIIHIGTGPVIILAWYFNLSKALAASAAGIVTLCLAINYKFRLFPGIEDIKRKSFGTIAYGISITLLLIVFWPQYSAAVCLGILAMAFGDGFASLVGQSIKSPNWLILGQKKSLAGTLTIAIAVSMISLVISLIIGIDIQPIQIILLAIISTVLEQISPLGIDNLTVPIGSTVAWVFLFNN